MTDATAFTEDIANDRGSDEPLLIVDVEGFEGPLDLLLTMARQQKVDLAKISILALADQYLAFVEQSRRLRLELAADYLVIASWLPASLELVREGALEMQQSGAFAPIYLRKRAGAEPARAQSSS